MKISDADSFRCDGANATIERFHGLHTFESKQFVLRPAFLQQLRIFIGNFRPFGVEGRKLWKCRIKN